MYMCECWCDRDLKGGFFMVFGLREGCWGGGFFEEEGRSMVG